MGAFKDLTGARFGSLTVLRRADDYISPSGKHTARWLCHCDACGKDVVMLRNTLIRAKSCGCLRGEKLSVDLTGRHFGKWTVIKKAKLPKTDSNGAQNGWLCRCECGTERVIPARYLTSGGSKSCGCDTAQKARSRINDDNVLGRYNGTVISTINPSRPPNRNNASGVKGVYWSSREKCWIAKIGFRGKTITIGRYKDLKDAARARSEAEQKYFAPAIESYKANHQT